jgi:hypothetical protein
MGVELGFIGLYVLIAVLIYKVKKLKTRFDELDRYVHGCRYEIKPLGVISVDADKQLVLQKQIKDLIGTASDKLVVLPTTQVEAKNLGDVEPTYLPVDNEAREHEASNQ